MKVTLQGKPRRHYAVSARDLLPGGAGDRIPPNPGWSKSSTRGHEARVGVNGLWEQSVLKGVGSVTTLGGFRDPALATQVLPWAGNNASALTWRQFIIY